MLRSLIGLFLFNLAISPGPPVSPGPPLHPKPTLSKEGEICGGMLPPEMIHKCGPKLECVNTHGPKIADAPGTCHPRCPTLRDQW